MIKSLVSCLCVFSLFAAAAQTRHFSADDLPKIVRVGDPRIAPDGKTIAFVVGRSNLKEDRWETELDLIDTAGQHLRVLTHGRLGVGGPQWSPTGDRIAFIAQDADKKAQLYVLPIDGGDAEQVTHSKTGVRTFAWRPDGAAIAYAASDETPEKKDEAKFDDAFEVGNNDMLLRERPMPIHLWLQVLGKTEPKRLTSGAWSLPNPNGGAPRIEFTPDGKTLLFPRADTPLTGDTATARLQVLNVETGALHPLTGLASDESEPIVSEDGTQVAFVGPRDHLSGSESSLYVMALAGGSKPVDAAAAIDHDLHLIDWLPGGKSLLVSAADGTHTSVWEQPLGGKAVKLSFGNLNPGAIAIGKQGGFAFAATQPDRPAELFYLAKASDTPVQLTHLQTVTDGVALGRQETVKWKSDAFTVDGVLTYPPDYVAGKKYPLVLYIHGGPTGTSLETFTPSSQILAAKGWLVFEPNYRGGNGEGNVFQRAIIKDAGVGPGHDVMAGIKLLEARGIVDETKIAVSGWSYGGYMTSWLIGNYPAVWKAAVAGAPVTDMTDIYDLSDVTSYALDIFGPSPWVGDNLKLYVAESPITYASRMRTPTLIMCDVGDYRVPIPMAYKLFHALKDNGVPVKFVAFPVGGHSPADPIRARDVWRRWTAWLGAYLDEPAAVKAKAE